MTLISLKTLQLEPSVLYHNTMQEKALAHTRKFGSELEKYDGLTKKIYS